MQNLLSTKEVASIIGVCPRVLRRWNFRGEGPKPIIQTPRVIKYDPRDIEAWLNDLRQQRAH